MGQTLESIKLWRPYQLEPQWTRELKTVMEILEEDATNILQFMASNGLVANPTKAEFMLLSNKKG